MIDISWAGFIAINGGLFALFIVSIVGIFLAISRESIRSLIVMFVINTLIIANCIWFNAWVFISEILQPEVDIPMAIVSSILTVMYTFSGIKAVI